MNLFEVFDKTPENRTYYQTKRPVAVILTLLGFTSLILCTPAGAAFLKGWIEEQEMISFTAPVMSWVVAIGFDLGLAYLLSQWFSGVFTGIDGRKNYIDIPTTLLVVLFGGVTLAWSFWGTDMRKAIASKEIAQQRAATIDSAFHAVTAISTGNDQLTKTRKGMTRQERKNNEAIAAAMAASTEQTKILSNITQEKIEASQQAEASRHKIIDSGKMVIIGAYLFLLITIGCVEYIKSQKKPEEAKQEAKVRSINDSDNEKKKNLIKQAQELRAENMSLRAIGRELEISHTQVANLLKEAVN